MSNKRKIKSIGKKLDVALEFFEYLPKPPEKKMRELKAFASANGYKRYLKIEKLKITSK